MASMLDTRPGSRDGPSASHARGGGGGSANRPRDRASDVKNNGKSARTSRSLLACRRSCSTPCPRGAPAVPLTHEQMQRLAREVDLGRARGSTSRPSVGALPCARHSAQSHHMDGAPGDKPEGAWRVALTDLDQCQVACATRATLCHVTGIGADFDQSAHTCLLAAPDTGRRGRFLSPHVWFRRAVRSRNRLPNLEPHPNPEGARFLSRPSATWRPGCQMETLAARF